VYFDLFSSSSVGELSLVLNGLSCTIGSTKEPMRFPVTRFDGGVLLICRNSDATSFASLIVQERGVLILGSLNNFSVGELSYPGGAYIVQGSSGSTISPFSFASLAAGASLFPALPSDVSIAAPISGMVMSVGPFLSTKRGQVSVPEILNANYSLSDGFDSDFEKWLFEMDNVAVKKTRFFSRDAVVSGIHRLVDLCLPGGINAGGGLRRAFLDRSVPRLNTEKVVFSSGGNDYISVDPVIDIVRSLGRVYDRCCMFALNKSRDGEVPVIPSFVGDLSLDRDFGLQSSCLFGVDAEVGCLRPVTSDDAYVKAIEMRANVSLLRNLARESSSPSVRKSIEAKSGEIERSLTSLESALGLPVSFPPTTPPSPPVVAARPLALPAPTSSRSTGRF
jgi:hypothetical protein